MSEVEAGREVLVRVEGHTGWVTINRPERSNAIAPETAARLAEIVTQLETDDLVRVVVLTGAGPKAFCAGSDLKAKASGAAPAVIGEWGFAGFVRAPRTKPYIAAVNGVAAGGGFEIALACDLIVAADHAQFFLPEVDVGLVAGGGGLIRLLRRVPPAVAREMVIAGRRLDAAEALRVGLVNEVVPAADLVDAARELAARCAVGAPLAVRESLAVMAEAEGSSSVALWERSWEASLLVAASADGKEGPRAFAERRRPVWQGR